MSLTCDVMLTAAEFKEQYLSILTDNSMPLSMAEWLADYYSQMWQQLLGIYETTMLTTQDTIPWDLEMATGTTTRTYAPKDASITFKGISVTGVPYGAFIHHEREDPDEVATAKFIKELAEYESPPEDCPAAEPVTPSPTRPPPAKYLCDDYRCPERLPIAAHVPPRCYTCGALMGEIL